MRLLALSLLFVPFYSFAMCTDHFEHVQLDLNSQAKVSAYMQQKPSTTIKAGYGQRYEVELLDPSCVQAGIAQMQAAGVVVVAVEALATGKGFSDGTITMNEVDVKVDYKSGDFWTRSFRDVKTGVASLISDSVTSTDTTRFACPLQKRYAFKQTVQH